jgi:N-acetylglucosaminyldiphosphoundecaprenol N-acetyl-beta-D-mannosaminyltransferase
MRLKNSLARHTFNREDTVPEVDILGVRVHQILASDIQSIILRMIRGNERGVFLYVHLHSINIAQTDTDLRDVLNAATITYCDGEGVRLGARILGHSLPERIPLTRWIYPLLDFCARNHLSVYCVGTENRIIHRAVELLREGFPALNIVGYHDGFFHSREDEVNEVLQSIHAARPDILIVGMGTPLQELWIRDHWDVLQAGCILSAGSCFDYIAGEKQACPAWMADHGLEWLHRLFREPRRVWRRYLIGIPVFLWRILRQRFSM